MTISFPLKLNAHLGEWADRFPARHGRVTFGQFAGDAARMSPEMVRVLIALHFEFSDFHQKISQPLDAATDGLAVLSDYVAGLSARLEFGKGEVGTESEYSPLSRAAMLIELLQICLVDSAGLPAARLPRWLIRHCGLHIDRLVVRAESILDSSLTQQLEKEFWEIIKSLAVLDLSPVMAKLLARYLHSHLSKPLVSRHSAELLLAFFEDVPSLFDLSMGSRSRDEAVHSLEKRRGLASVAFFKDREAVKESSLVNFIWRLQIGADDDYEYLLSELISTIKFPTDDGAGEDEVPWYQRVGLVWAWLHPVDEPGAELMASLGQRVTESSNVSSTATASVVDAAIYAIMASDMLSLTSLVEGESADASVFGGAWFSAILADVVFYSGGFLGDTGIKIRDTMLMDYCHWLTASGAVPAGLGARVAADIVNTLSESASERGAEEVVGKLLHCGGILNRTKHWLNVVKLESTSESTLSESVSMEKFHQDARDGRLVDAVHALSVAAEVGADVNLGACRISDFLDTPCGIRESLVAADEASAGHVLGAKTLLPEYIESGRLEFHSDWVKATSASTLDGEGDKCVVIRLIRLVTSPNCPPESIVPIATEIRHHVVERGTGLSMEHGVALAKVLTDLDEWLVSDTDKGPIDMLLGWISGVVVASSLA